VITLHSPHTGSSLATLATTVRDAIEDLRDVFGDLITQALGWLLEIADSDAVPEMAIGSSFLTISRTVKAPFRTSSTSPSAVSASA
jgi:hypothetical protein